MLLGVAVPATVAHALDPGAHVGATFHLLTGAAMLGAFHRDGPRVRGHESARPPDSGAGIGFVTWLIRALVPTRRLRFAEVDGNLARPLIDRYTVPRIYGHARR